MLIGNGHSNRYFVGSMDDVRIWSVARTAEEIQDYMNRSLSGNEDNLEVNLSFNEGLGDIAFDLTDNDYDAKIIGPIWTDDLAPVYNVGTTDDQGNYEINGINYGSGTTFTAMPSKVTPINSYSLYFEGDSSHVVVEHDDRLNPASFTIEAWAKLGGATSPNGAIVDKRYNDGGVLQGYLIQVTGSDQVRGGLGSGDNWNLISGSTWNYVDWHHVALVYDGTVDTLRFYEDGLLMGSREVTSPAFVDSSNLAIGATLNMGGVSSFFNGNIDEIRIWSIARSQIDIQSTMNNILNGDEDGLAAY